MKQAM